MMNARELVDDMLDKRGMRLTLGNAPCATFDIHFRQDFAVQIERYARSCLVEAADRVEDTLRKMNGVFYQEEVREAIIGEQGQ
jgi:hypothetical protein